MKGPVEIGGRVETPDGPGTVVSFWQVFSGLHWRQDPVVELDQGQRWRKIYQVDELEEEEHSTRAENQAEALYIERHQEAKHGDPED